MHGNRWAIILKIVSLICFVLLTINLFIVSVFKFHIRSLENFERYIDQVNVKSEVIKANRGTIYDSNGEIIARDIITYNVVCYLNSDRLAAGGEIAYVNDIDKTAKVFNEILGDDISYYKDLLSNKDVYQTEIGSTGRNISTEQKEQIESYGLKGVEFVKSVDRHYPFNTFASYLIGFTTGDEYGTQQGANGVEYWYNDELKGVDGSALFQTTASEYILDGMLNERIEPKHGNDIYLTIDRSVQEALENAMVDTVKTHEASAVWGGVMEVDTGKMIAYGQYPSFDPNIKVIEQYKDYGSQIEYEPGSVFKVFTYAAAINEGNYNGKLLYDSSPYCFGSDGFEPYRTYGNPIGCINNSRDANWGMIELNEGFYRSSNVATSTLVTQVINSETFLDYVDKFGFFKSVNTDNIKDTEGSLNYHWAADKLALSYGQGSTVTCLQMLQGLSAVFGDGSIVKPYFVESIVNKNTNVVEYQAETIKGEKFLKDETLVEMNQLLHGVVYDEVGTAADYAVPELEIVAKTGTAQIAIDGSYTDHNQIIASVAIGYPANDPKYIIYYAFQADYTFYNHNRNAAQHTLLRAVANYHNINLESQVDEHINKFGTSHTVLLGNYINNSVEYSLNKLKSASSEIVVIADGDTVIDQYPKSNKYASEIQKIFLLTNGENLKAPNFSGWSVKDLERYSLLTGVKFTIEGTGVVTSQSILEEQPLVKGDIIVVNLS